MIEANFAPEAHFDTVAIIGSAPRSVAPVAIIELHLYAYLACILGLFKGNPAGAWGYGFTVTPEGFPFSFELESSRAFISSRGWIEEDGRGTMTARGDTLKVELDRLAGLRMFSDRYEALRAATRCAVALPVGAIRGAINRSPGMVEPLALGQAQALLREGDVGLIHDECRAIELALGDKSVGLLSPAVLWLSSRLFETAENDA